MLAFSLVVKNGNKQQQLNAHQNLLPAIGREILVEFRYHNLHITNAVELKLNNIEWTYVGVLFYHKWQS